MCERDEREREVGKLILLKIDWIFVCVCESERHKEAERFILFGFKLWCC